ncbi:MAG: hypothetical protein HY928_10615, partial [Elusimicrobia bacterium]|nr:hypothetical protein [Elusimicrobiota bacterium]
METRLLLAGLALAAWSRAARRWGSSRPLFWRCAFGAVLGAAAALLVLPSYLGADGSGPPAPREWAAAAVLALLGAWWVRATPPGYPADPLAEALPWAES